MSHSFSRVAVIGLGYIGLPTAAIIAIHGLEVIGVDVNVKVVDTINQGKIHIVEPDLDAIVHRAVSVSKLRAGTLPEPADVFIIAVPTPCDDRHKPDISHIEAAARSIAPFLKKECLVILESTSPVGTTEHVISILSEARPDLSFPSLQGTDDSDVNVAYCPERVLPGNILYELAHNDRVIGGMTKKCSDRAILLYQTFVKGRFLTTDTRTAEMVKLTENSFRDVNIAFANELSIICDHLNVNVWELVRLANHHPRVNILKPGPGVGGHCIAVDPWFIVHSFPEQAQLIRKAREVNSSKPKFVLQKVVEAIAATQKDSPIIGCLGLSFKANIDDLRESPALEIALEIARKDNLSILVVEPHITQLPEALRDEKIELVDLQAGCSRADVIVVLVDHKEFHVLKEMDLSDKIVIDTRGLLENHTEAS